MQGCHIWFPLQINFVKNNAVKLLDDNDIGFWTILIQESKKKKTVNT